MRLPTSRLVLIAAAAALAAAGLTMAPAGAAPSVSAPTFDAPAGPALQTPAATLAAALDCSSDLATTGKTPILLVPGTSVTPEINYSWGYQKVLREQGYAVCAVSLPGGGTGDMQTTVEYVVSAIRSMSETSRKEVSILGHSQGGLLPAWAIRYWPDLASRVDDVVSLDAPYGGSRLADYICDPTHSCPALAWQVTRNSDFTRALRRSPIPAGVSYTSIGTNKTDLVFPSPDATYLPGATNVFVQDICPGRYVSHLAMAWDAPAHGLVMDALTHEGAAKVSRVSTTLCDREQFEGVDKAAMLDQLWSLDQVLEYLFDATWLETEPPLREYAIGKPGDTELARDKPVTVSSTESSSYAATKAVDGDRSTRWSTGAWKSSNWIAVDLGSTKTINGVQIQWEAAYADAYSIQRWNGSTWETVWSTENGDGGNSSIALDAVSSRHLRVLMTGGPCCFNNYSMWELQVAGR